jgi:hypothetical protein
MEAIYASGFAARDEYQVFAQGRLLISEVGDGRRYRPTVILFS